MIAYEIVVSQFRAFCMFRPFLPQLQVPCCRLLVASQQLWLQGNPFLLAQPPGANYCFPGLNCSGTVHWPKSLPACEGIGGCWGMRRERTGMGARIPSFPGWWILSCLSGCFSKVAWGCSSITTSVAAEETPPLHCTPHKLPFPLPGTTTWVVVQELGWRE